VPDNARPRFFLRRRDSRWADLKNRSSLGGGGQLFLSEPAAERPQHEAK
jgi:hypothetical protein